MVCILKYLGPAGKKPFNGELATLFALFGDSIIEKRKAFRVLFWTCRDITIKDIKVHDEFLYEPSCPWWLLAFGELGPHQPLPKAHS